LKAFAFPGLRYLSILSYQPKIAGNGANAAEGRVPAFLKWNKWSVYSFCQLNRKQGLAKLFTGFRQAAPHGCQVWRRRQCDD
jgi:hypothetical protein